MREALTREDAAGAPPLRAAGWRRWAPWAAVAWSLLYAGLGAYWAVSGRGFPYAPELVPDITGPFVGRLGPVAAWAVVAAVGLPAAAVGTVLARGGRAGRPLLLGAGFLVSGVLLLLMIDVNLLTALGYLPFAVVSLVAGGELGGLYLRKVLVWPLPHQLLCLAGGFLWLLATLSHARRTGASDARENGWTSPASAARWGRWAVYASLVVPVFYAATRLAWALGVPLGISEEFLREGQETGMWTAGLSLALFGLVGAVLTLGLTQRWGEVFPRWMVGLAGRRVPVALAVVPASVVSVLLMVAGIAMASGYAEAVAESVSGSMSGVNFVGALPTLLLPVWGGTLAAATLGYVYRRRGA